MQISVLKFDLDIFHYDYLKRNICILNTGTSYFNTNLLYYNYIDIYFSSTDISISNTDISSIAYHHLL